MILFVHQVQMALVAQLMDGKRNGRRKLSENIKIGIDMEIECLLSVIYNTAYQVKKVLVCHNKSSSYRTVSVWVVFGYNYFKAEDALLVNALANEYDAVPT